MDRYILFGKDLSLEIIPDNGVAPYVDSGSPGLAGHTEAADAGQHCTEAQGKKDQAVELVDYLGVVPVLETVSTPSLQSNKSCDMMNNPERISTQLTMFYAGTVKVFDNVVADKAQIVLSFAEKSASMQATTPSFKMPVASSTQPSAPYGLHLQDWMKSMQPEMSEKHTWAASLSVGERLPVTSTDNAQELATLLVPCQAIVPTALPIARKASLARFFEKRKERIRLLAPYMAKGNAPNIIHAEGTHPSNASTLQPYHHNFFAGSDAQKLSRCASALAFVDVNDHHWITGVKNSEQASESESAA